MDISVPGLSILFMIFSLIGALVVPIGLLLYLKIKKKADLLPFWIGCAVFIVFALILERIAQLPLLLSPNLKVIQSNLWLNAIIGGLYAGVFEETGRFVAFKTILKKRNGKDVNALMYGAGHGGFEMFFLLFSGMLNNLVISILINSGNVAMLTTGITDQTTLTTLSTLFQTLATTPSYMFLIGLAERLSAVLLHISLSVLVWLSAKNSKKIYLFPIAIVLHLVMDAGAIVLSKIIFNSIIVEGCIAAFSIAIAVLAFFVWKQNKKQENTVNE